MLTWIRQYAATHVFYIILIAGGAVGFRCWLSEHDARLAADTTVKTAQAQVATLQAQITAVNSAAAQKVQIVTKVIHDAATPAQVVAAIPSLTDLPLQARVSPLNPTDIEVAALPFMQLVGELKTAQINLQACVDTSALKDQQLAAKDTAITTLKKKPNLLHRVVGVAKAVGVGIGIGVLLGAKL